MLDLAGTVSLRQNLLLLFQQEIGRNGVISSKKSDSSLVTNIDLAISHFLQEFAHKNHLNFLSEEDDNHSLKFPIMIVDPIDGTRELARGIEEVAISIAILYSPDVSDSKNICMIVNPFTGHTSTNFDSIVKKTNRDQVLSGLVSRSEWESDLFHEKLSSQVLIKPCGSIAYKLSRLYKDECDFVVTMKPKNIWDIAAGSCLNAQAGNQFYQDGNRITKLDKLKFDAPMYWGSESNYNLLLSVGFFN